MGELTLQVSLPEIIASLDRLHAKVDMIMSEDAAIRADIAALQAADTSIQDSLGKITTLLGQLKDAGVAPETVAALDAEVASLTNAASGLSAVANPPA